MSILISDISMVKVTYGEGILEVSGTPITNDQYAPPIEERMGQGAMYLEVMRGLNERVAANLLSEATVRDSYGRYQLTAASSGKIVRAGSVFLSKLNPRPSPEGFNRANQPVVNVAPVQVEGWCEIAGHGLRLLRREEMLHILTGGGKLKYPTSTGDLFDSSGRRLVHGSLELRDEEVVAARVRETSTCDVDATNPDGALIYPDGPFGTRIAQAGVMLIAAGDLFFGGYWYAGHPDFFEGSHYRQGNPDYRGDVAGFVVGCSSQDSR